MSHLIRILLALQISIVVVAGCAVDDDGADTDLTASSDVAEPADSEAVVAPGVAETALDGIDGAAAADSITAQARRCTGFRLDNRASAGTCRNFCARPGGNQAMLNFDNRRKICVCCALFPNRL